MSLKNRILNYFERYDEKHPGMWVSGLDIEREALHVRAKPSTASRRLRELASEGSLLRRETKGFVEYRYAKTSMQAVQADVPVPSMSNGYQVGQGQILLEQVQG